MKRVLIISVEYPPKCGGAGRVAEDNVEYLSNNGFEVDVVTTYDSHISRKKNVNYYFLKHKPVVFVLSFIIQLKKMDLSQYQTIILNDIGAALVASYIFDDFLLSKSLIYIHGGEPEEVLLKPKALFKAVQFPNKYKKMLLSSKRIVCVSEFMRRKMMKIVSDIPFSKFSVIYNGVNKQDFYKDPFDIRKEYGLEKNTTVIFSASRVIVEKGYDDVFDVISKCINEGEKIAWFIAGEGDYLTILKTKIHNNHLEDNIFLLGNLNRESLRKYYSSADLFVLLSKFEEAYGLVYLESIYCLTPVVALKNGGTNEAIIDRVNGFIVKDRDECYQVIKKKQFLKITEPEIKDSLSQYDLSKEELKCLCSN